MKNVLCLGALCLLVLACPMKLYSYPFKKPDLSTSMKMARDNPSNTYWLSTLAGHYEKRKDLTNASVLYKKCVKLEPDNSEHYLHLTSVYLKMGRPDHAEPVIGTAARNFTNNAKVMSAMADVRYKLGDPSNAVVYFNRALKLTGGSNASFVYCGLAKSYRELKRFDRSEACFRKALEIKKDLWTFYEYAKLLEDNGDPEHAAWAFEKARSLGFRQEKEVVTLLQEKLAGAYYACGMKWKAEGKKAEARKCFNRILEDRGLQNTKFAERASFWIRRL